MDGHVAQATLADLFKAHLACSKRINFIRGKDDEVGFSYRELHETALRRLFWLTEKGFRRGDKAVLCLRDDVRFVELFWACLLGGIVPVPVASGNSAEHKQKLIAILDQLGDAHVLTEAKVLVALEAFLHEQGDRHRADELRPRAVLTEAPPSDCPFAEEAPGGPQDLAFIQYSSGSTRQPKGVMITHANLAANIRDLVDAFGFAPEEVSLSWMPLTHDMGIIGFHLCAIAAGMTHHIMSTQVFTRRPLLWMQKATEKRATVLCSPNFGYKHYLRAFRAAEQVDLDLSRVRQIVNGAEPISRRLVAEFMESLAPAGLRASAMCPAYGMAEASLGLCVSEKGTGMRTVSVDRASLNLGNSVRLVEPGAPGSIDFAIEGFPLPLCELRIGSGAARAAPEGTIGEIEIRGANVTSGYFGEADADAALFTADGWLRTGDIGFLHRGEIVVTGRLKDVIFFNGQNYYPHDIEAVIEEAGLAQLGGVAVCAVPADADAEDTVLVFLRSRKETAAFREDADRVKRAVFSRVGIDVAHVLPITRIPKTTSGKVRRYALAKAFQDGAYDEMAARLHAAERPAATEAPASATSDAVLARLRDLASAAEIDPVSLDHGTDFFDIGITSPMLAELSQLLDEDFPELVDVTDFFDHTSVTEIAALIDARRLEAADAQAGSGQLRSAS